MFFLLISKWQIEADILARAWIFNHSARPGKGTNNSADALEEQSLERQATLQASESAVP